MRLSETNIINPRRRIAFMALALIGLFCGTAGSALAQGLDSPGAVPSQRSTAAIDSGPIRLRPQPQDAETTNDGRNQPKEALESAGSDAVVEPVRYQPNEFERFVRAMAGQEVRRLGSELVLSATGGRAAETGAAVPPDYRLAPGDEVLVLAWGSVDADLRLTIDRGGNINVPRVGAVQIGGVRYDQLSQVVERRFAQVFRNFQVSATLGKLRGIRVLVTGYVHKPGTYSVSPLSTMVGAVMQAGGPSQSGSFRRLELKRAGTIIARLDLYDLLLKGDDTMDRLLQAGDVVHVEAVGKQIGVIGSVNRAAVVELRDGEDLLTAIKFAAGFSALADRDRVTIERLRERTTKRVVQVDLPAGGSLTLENGDVVRVLSAAQAVVSTVQQNKRIRVDGEVLRPGEYVLPPNSTLQDAIRASGGLTTNAFVYGTQFARRSVQASQQENYDRALRDMETDFARAAGTQRFTSGDQTVQVQARSMATSRLVERLRALKPSGRVVLQLSPQSQDLPDLALEDEDRLYIPPRPTTVGVFGSVFNTGSYLYADGRQVGDYLRLAGGPTNGADESSIFVIRSNGQVISGRQTRGNSWFSSSNASLYAVRAEPGDTVFVPEEMDKTTFLQAAKDWTQVLYQFGIGIAGITNALR